MKKLIIFLYFFLIATFVYAGSDKYGISIKAVINDIDFANNIYNWCLTKSSLCWNRCFWIDEPYKITTATDPIDLYSLNINVRTYNLSDRTQIKNKLIAWYNDNKTKFMGKPKIYIHICYNDSNIPKSCEEMKVDME
jgi:hypothetical protein